MEAVTKAVAVIPDFDPALDALGFNSSTSRRLTVLDPRVKSLLAAAAGFPALRGRRRG